MKIIMQYDKGGMGNVGCGPECMSRPLDRWTFNCASDRSLGGLGSQESRQKDALWHPLSCTMNRPVLQTAVVGVLGLGLDVPGMFL
jgi:hypothetical protein